MAYSVLKSSSRFIWFFYAYTQYGLQEILILNPVLEISHFFQNFKGVLEMTAHLGKAVREGSRAEPAHEGVEYAHSS